MLRPNGHFHIFKRPSEKLVSGPFRWELRAWKARPRSARPGHLEAGGLAAALLIERLGLHGIRQRARTVRRGARLVSTGLALLGDHVRIDAADVRGNADGDVHGDRADAVQR